MIQISKKIILLGIALFSSQLFAKDLYHRLGIGVKNNTVVDMPALAAAYYSTKDYAWTGGFGMDTQRDQSRLQIDVGLRKIIFKEEQLNFYFGGGLGLLNTQVNGAGTSGIEAKLVFGSEFFLTGLDSLSFLFEGGFGVTTNGDTRFRTIGDTPLRAGMLFYF